jgi:Transglycosylase-like domain
LRKVLAGCLCAIAAAAPTVAFAATNDDNNDINLAVVPQAAKSLTFKHDAKQKLNTAVARAHREERKANKRKRERRLAKQRAQTQAAAPTASGSAPSGNLQAIAACESGGNPSAVGGGGAFRGKYQFDYGTWASVGGSGDPAAAPEAEQDQRAAMLYSRSGSNPWPVCGQ